MIGSLSPSSYFFIYLKDRLLAKDRRCSGQNKNRQYRLKNSFYRRSGTLCQASKWILHRKLSASFLTDGGFLGASLSCAYKIFRTYSTAFLNKARPIPSSGTFSRVHRG